MLASQSARVAELERSTTQSSSLVWWTTRVACTTAGTSVQQSPPETVGSEQGGSWLEDRAPATAAGTQHAAVPGPATITTLPATTAVTGVIGATRRGGES